MYQESAFKADWNTSQHYQNSNDRYCCHFINFPVTGGLRRTPDQQQFYAKMASLAYGGTPEGRSAKMNDFGFTQDWVLDTELSNPDVAVMVNPTTKEVVSSVTGSRFSDPVNKFRDISTDIGIALGVDKFGKRTSEVQGVVQQARDKYKDYDMTLAGHSLGGKVATNISHNLNIPAVVFNRGSSPLGFVTDKIMNLFNRDKKPDQTIHYTTNNLAKGVIDPLSVSSALLDDGETKMVDKRDGSQAHAIINFTGEGRRRRRRKKSENSNEVSDLFSTKVSHFPASRAELIRAIQSSPFDVLETTGNARYDRGSISDHDFPRRHQMMVEVLRGML